MLVFNFLVHDYINSEIDHKAIINSTGTDLVIRAIKKDTEKKYLKSFLKDFIKNKKSKNLEKLLLHEKERSKKPNESHLAYYLSTGKSCLKTPPYSGWQPFFPDIYDENKKNKESSSNDETYRWISYENKEYNFSNRPTLPEYLHLLSCKSPMNYNGLTRKFILILMNHFSRFILTSNPYSKEK